MNDLVLSKKHFNGRIMVGTHWISNGHFLIHKARVKNASFFVSELTVRLFDPKLTFVELKDSQVEAILEKHQEKSLKFYTDTNWRVKDHFVSSHAFIGPEDKIIFIDEDYAYFLSDCLWGTELGKETFDAPKRADVTVIVMPRYQDTKYALITKKAKPLTEGQ